MEMKKLLNICLVTVFVICSMSVLAQNKNEKNRTISFDKKWLFIKKNVQNGEHTKFDDSSWRKVDLPHDWSIEDLPDQIADSIVGPFSKAALSQRDGGFMIGGTAWYRKHFVLDKESKGKKVIIQFDGVYMNSDVWVNGHHLGNHIYGYTPFYYDLTPYLLPAGQSNVIAVQVKNEGNNSRWYSGSGIYRHVWLTMVNPLHIDIYGTYITTPVITKDKAKVSIETTIKNSGGIGGKYKIISELFDATGKLVGSNTKDIELLKSNNSTTQQLVIVENPRLWSLETPELYKAKVKILKGKKVIDETSTDFGIRTIKFDAKTGFTLNGKKLLLHGGCIHHDNGPLGAAAIDRAEERKIMLLKKNGFNAIRLSHNPFSTELLKACDRLGMLVINEAFDMWKDAKKPDDYHIHFDKCWEKDITSMVLRDRNHPSIIMWSTGNEIYESIDTDGYETGKKLADAIRSLDSTRPVTMAIPKFILAMSSRKGKKWDDTAPSFANVDVCGYNYATSKYKKDHEKFPERVMYESEAFPPQVYESWEMAKKYPFAIGMFTWSAMDYLGEAGIGVPRIVPENELVNSNLFLEPDWPIFNAYCGELDLIGNKKVNSYYLDVVWDRSEVEMLVQPSIPEGYKEVDFYYNFPKQIKSWSFPKEEGKKMKVFVHTKGSLVKLELNGKFIAAKNILPNTITAEFMVPYKPGILVAKSFQKGKLIGTDTLKTTGTPYAIRLRPERDAISASENDLSYVHTEVIDKDGNVVPYVDDLIIHYQVNGKAKVIGVGNGNPADMSSFQKPEKKVYNGRGLVILKPSGEKGNYTLKASAEGLKSSEVTIKIE